MQSVHTEPGAWDVIKNIGIDVVLTAASVGPLWSMVYGLRSFLLLLPLLYDSSLFKNGFQQRKSLSVTPVTKSASLGV